MKVNDGTGRTLIETIHETLRTAEFRPTVKESSGIPEDLSDAEIRELINEIKKQK